jgi:hypothetical protein
MTFFMSRKAPNISHAAIMESIIAIVAYGSPMRQLGSLSYLKVGCAGQRAFLKRLPCIFKHKYGN